MNERQSFCDSNSIIFFKTIKTLNYAFSGKTAPCRRDKVADSNMEK